MEFVDTPVYKVAGRVGVLTGKVVDVSALSDALNEANRQRLTARQISRAARAAGHSLSHQTANEYLRGNHGQPDEATLQALAYALATNVGRLRAASGILTDDDGPFELPAEAVRLTRRQRHAVLSVVTAMLEPIEAVEGGRGEVRFSGEVRRKGAAKEEGSTG